VRYDGPAKLDADNAYDFPMVPGVLRCRGMDIAREQATSG
jgi:hypothetical protein